MNHPHDLRQPLLTDLEMRLAGIADRARAADEAGELPPENWREVVDSGYPQMFHPVTLGGLALDGVTQARAMETLARACPSTFWSATMSVLVCVKLISTHGNLDDHRDLIGSLIDGRRLACFAVVERTSGSDPGTYATTVRRRGDHWVVDGEKSRVTNATSADVAVVFARLPEHGDGWCYAFVDLGQERVHTYDIPHLGLRAMPWGGIVLDGAHVHARDVVPLRLERLSDAMAWGWLFISIAAIAIAESALDCAVRHARSQVAFGRALGHMEAVQSALAQTRVEIDAARLLAYRCAWHRAQGRLVPDLVGMLKPYATEMAVRATSRAVQVLGAHSLTPGNPVERLYRDAPMNVIGGFASNRLRDLVAGQIGLPPTYQPFDWLDGTGLDLDPRGLTGAAGT
ncbi:acyl-CoA dehydrogenase family protein [Micromonospora marina]|uniref:acyl-CoA dehydrogenase family protein n=1 Tax=Micromonospora marina TaxID=307120 RepID=UPI003452FCF0